MLSFCVLNQLAVMNTYFVKKSIYKHLACIDYVIMRQKQRRLCLNVSVVRSAECWTDPTLLKAKLRLHVPPKRKSKIRQRYAVDGLCNVKTREQCSKSVMDMVSRK